MKKFLSILMVLATVFTLSMTAFAAGTGTITISNATVGQTYNLYKFFDATYATDSLGNQALDSDGNPIVSYTIDPGNKFYVTMFGTDGTAHNDYFDHDPATHAVTKKGTASDKDVIAYLDSLAAAVTPDASITATSSTVNFTGLDTGYYLVDRGTTSTVTITTNMPNASIIDKNQKPGSNFDKVILDGGLKLDSDVAGIGDIVDFEISFVATNYDGDNLIKYYTIHDVKSSALWVEFDSVKVSVGGTELKKGYYFFAGPMGSPAETGEWDYLGDWGSAMKTPENADWYLIHHGYDEFDVVIPWLDDYTFTGNDSLNTYELTFDLSETDGNTILSESIYAPTTDVVLTYTAAVGPDAITGTVKNEATLDWEHTEGSSGDEDPERTEIKVHNLGITKIADDAAKTRLAGATFELYSDAACTVPVYVIPTGVEGVYILDDIDTVISGIERITSREKYAGAALDAWLAADPDPDSDGTNRRNDMTTPANGQLVVLGLEDNTYYLKETEAPAGYNKLSLPVEIEVGGSSVSTYDSGYQVYGATVKNNRGVELPSTGGAGTFWLITIGSLMAIGFAVFLITHKKMSVYAD